MRATQSVLAISYWLCVNGPEGEVIFEGGDYVFRDPDELDADPTTIANCAIVSGFNTSRYLTLNKDVLPLLENTVDDDTEYPGTTRTLTIQTLTAGIFKIDDFQILDSTVLPAGFYEENVGTNILVPDNADDWITVPSAVYSGGQTLQTNVNDATDPTPDATLTLDFNGTGLSIVTAYLTNGGTLELTVSDGPGGIDDIIETLDTRRAANIFGISMTVAGLPEGNYTATLNIFNDLGERVIIDAIEVYGPLNQLGSLYDDADVNVNGETLITYGPTNASWVELTGAAALTGLNQTLHSAIKQGSLAAFENWR